MRLRTGLVWLALPLMIAAGGGVGYLAAEAWSTRSGAASAEATHGDAGHGGSVDSGHDHGTADSGPTDDGAAHGETAHGETAHGETAHGETAHGEPADDETAQDETAHGVAGHDDSTPAAPVSRPRTAVFGTFAAVNAAILLGAVVLRRRGRDRPRRRPVPPAPVARTA